MLIKQSYWFGSRTSKDTARKTIFPRSWNIIESSKRPSKYHLSINFLAEKKAVFPITEKLNTRTSQQRVNIIFPSTFWLKKDRISHFRKDQNKNFSVISKYHLSSNFLAQKRPYFSLPKRPKQERFSNL